MLTIILFSNPLDSSTKYTPEAMADLVKQFEDKYPKCITYNEVKQQIIYKGPVLAGFETTPELNTLIWSVEETKLKDVELHKHYYTAVYHTIENRFDIFAGMGCECGALLFPDEIEDILNK